MKLAAFSKKRHILWRIILFFGLITFFFCLLLAATMPKYRAASQRLTGVDLSRDYLCLDASSGTVYPGRLYDSADFAAGDVSPGDPAAKYQTCRITLALTPGVTYGLTGQTATYAQRVYVDGVLLDETGTVSGDATAFVPRTDLYTIYFTPQHSETEIIIQHSWFNHQSGALHRLLLAEQPVITRTERAQTLCDGLITGSLLAMALFFMGMFLFRSSNREMLWFALSCLCAAVNYLIYESKQIMVFFPALNWYAGHKIEILTNVYYFVFILLFAAASLRFRPGKRASAGFFSLLGVLTVYYLAAPSTFYTRYTVPVGALTMAGEFFAAAALLRRAAREGLLRQAEQLIACLSPLLTLVVSVVEGVTYFSHILYLRAYAMILLAFCNALALTIAFARTERQLDAAQRRELEIAEQNALLEQMNRLKSDFMRNIAHEMKTPLAVMSGYAQLTVRQIEKHAVDAGTTANLDTIAREAERLADMVTPLLDVTYHGDARSAFLPAALLDDAAAVCRPVLLKNGNQLQTVCDCDRPLTAGRSALLQVLINLAVNANRHTCDGWIRLGASEAAGMVCFTVADNGSGIRPADLPHVFERGYSADGGSGLGLTICRETIESMGGTIGVAQTGASGTVIRFTVPSGEENP